MHSKIKISYLVGLFCWVWWWRFEVKIRTGTLSNRRPKWPKNLGLPQGGRYCVTGARRQEFEAAEWSWTRTGVIRLLWQVAYDLIPADHEHFELLVWPCMIARWHHCVTKARTCHFFAVCLTVFQFEFWRRTFTIGFHEKNIYQIRAYDFGVQFSFENSRKLKLLDEILSTASCWVNWNHSHQLHTCLAWNSGISTASAFYFFC